MKKDNANGKKAEHGGWQEMLHGLFQKKIGFFFVGLAGICLIFYPTHSVRRPKGGFHGRGAAEAHSRL